MRSGRKSEAQTKAPIKDRIKGSAVNKKGSASSTSRASSIVLSNEIIEALTKKADDFNQENKKNKVSLNTLKAVFRRGAGAFSTSHRPNMTRNGWAYARVNKFLEKKAGKEVKKAYIQDDDLMEKGGSVGQEITCHNCGWQWNTKDSDESDKYVCHKCGFDNTLFYSNEIMGKGGQVPNKEFFKWYLNWYKNDANKNMSIFFSLPSELTKISSNSDSDIILDVFEKNNDNVNAKKYLQNITDNADKYGVTIYLKPIPRIHKIKSDEHKKKITKDYLIQYYNNFGFKQDKNDFMVRQPKMSKGGLITNDKIEVEGLNNYTSTAKSGRFYNIFGKRKIGDGNEMWWISFSRKDDVNKFGYARYRNENDEEKVISLNELPKSLIEIYNNPDIKFGKGGLIAPNGKESNLTPKQYKLVRTPEFKEWFGDWENDPQNASKVVDENGEPLVVYHGTATDFNIFKVGSSRGIFFSNKKSSAELFSEGQYKRSGDKPQIKECFLYSLKPFYKNLTKDYILEKEYYENYFNERPFISEKNKKSILKKDNFKNEIVFFGLVDEDKKNKLIEFGYDGIIMDADNNAKSYIVFESNQIKLADGTNTTFDMNKADIRYKEGGQLSIDDNGLMDSIFPEVRDAFKKHGLKLEKNYAFTDGYNKMYLPYTGIQKTDGRIDKVAITYYEDGFEILGEIEVEVEDNGSIEIEMDFPNWQIKEEKSIYASGGHIDKVHKKLKEDLINDSFKSHKEIEQIAEEKGVELDYAKEQLRKGMQTESEHSNDPMVQEIIALQHLDEMIDYYQKLEHIEGKSMADGGFVADSTEKLIELVRNERENKTREWYKLGYRVVVARNDGYSYEKESERDSEFIDSKNPSQRKVIEIIKNNPNLKKIYFNGTIKVGNKVGEELEIADDFSVVLWEKNNTFLKEGLKFEFVQDEGKYINTIVNKKDTITYKDKDDDDRFVYYKQFDKKYNTISEIRTRKDFLEEDFDNKEAIIIKNTYEKGGQIDPDNKKTKDMITHKAGNAGGLLVGNRHSEGGIKAVNKSTNSPLEMEGGEVVITRNAVSDNEKREFEGQMLTNREILSKINESGGGVSFEDGGKVDYDCECDDDDDDDDEMANGGMVTLYDDYDKSAGYIIEKGNKYWTGKNWSDVKAYAESYKTKKEAEQKLKSTKMADGGVLKVSKGENDKYYWKFTFENGKEEKSFDGFNSSADAQRDFQYRSKYFKMADGGETKKANVLISHILDEAEGKLSEGRGESYVWDYIYKSVPSEIKGRDKRMEFADRLYDIVAKRVGKPLMKSDKMADGGKIANMYVVFFSRMLNGKSIPRVYEMYNTKEEAEKYVESRKQLGESGWKIKEAKDMPIYSMINIVNQTKNIELSNFLHSKEKVDTFFNGKDSFYKKDYAWVKPYGYTWENWKLVPTNKMADGGELDWGADLGDGFSIGNDVYIIDTKSLYKDKTGYVSGLVGKDLLVTISINGDERNVVVSKKGVERLDAPEFAKGGNVNSDLSDKELKDLVERLSKEKTLDKREEYTLMKAKYMLNKRGNSSKYDDGGKLDTHSELKQFFQEQNTPIVVEEPILEEIIEEEVVELPTEIMLYKEDLTSSDDFPMIYVGSSIYANNTNGSDEWVVKSFSNDGVNLLHIPSNPLAYKHEDKNITFDELTKLFKNNAISIKFVLNERELNLILMIIKDKLQHTQSFKVGGVVMADEDGADDEEIMKSQFGNKKF